MKERIDHWEKSIRHRRRAIETALQGSDAHKEEIERVVLLRTHAELIAAELALGEPTDKTIDVERMTELAGKLPCKERFRVYLQIADIQVALRQKATALEVAYQDALSMSLPEDERRGVFEEIYACQKRNHLDTKKTVRVLQELDKDFATNDERRLSHQHDVLRYLEHDFPEEVREAVDRFLVTLKEVNGEKEEYTRFDEVPSLVGTFARTAARLKGEADRIVSI